MFGTRFSSGWGMRTSGRGGGRDRGRGIGGRGGGPGRGGSRGRHGHGSIEFPGQGLGNRGGVRGRGGYGIPRGGNHTRNDTRNHPPNRQDFNGNRGVGTGSQPPPQRPQQGARQTTAGTQGVDQPTGTYNVSSQAEWVGPAFLSAPRTRASGGHGVLRGRVERPASTARQTAQRPRPTVADDNRTAWDIVNEYQDSRPGGPVPEKVKNAFAYLSGGGGGSAQPPVNETGAQAAGTAGNSVSSGLARPPGNESGAQAPGGVGIAVPNDIAQSSVKETGAQVFGAVNSVIVDEPARQSVNETGAKGSRTVVPFVPSDQSATSSIAPIQAQHSTEQHFQQVVVQNQSLVVLLTEEQRQYAGYVVQGQANLAQSQATLVQARAQLNKAVEATILQMEDIFQHGLEQLSRQLADQQRQTQELMIQHLRGMEAREQQARDEGHDQIMSDAGPANIVADEAHRSVSSMEDNLVDRIASTDGTTLADRVASWMSATNWRNEVKTYVLDQAGLNFDRRADVWQAIRAAFPTSTNIPVTPALSRYVSAQFNTFMNCLETKLQASQIKIVEKCFDLLDRSQSPARAVVTVVGMDTLEEHTREQIKQCVADSWLEAKFDCVREFRRVWMPMYFLTKYKENEPAFVRRWIYVEHSLRQMLGFSLGAWMHHTPVEEDLARFGLFVVENSRTQRVPTEWAEVARFIESTGTRNTNPELIYISHSTRELVWALSYTTTSTRTWT